MNWSAVLDGADAGWSEAVRSKRTRSAGLHLLPCCSGDQASYNSGKRPFLTVARRSASIASLPFYSHGDLGSELFVPLWVVLLGQTRCRWDPDGRLPYRPH